MKLIWSYKCPFPFHQLYQEFRVACSDTEILLQKTINTISAPQMWKNTTQYLYNDGVFLWRIVKAHGKLKCAAFFTPRKLSGWAVSYFFVIPVLYRQVQSSMKNVQLDQGINIFSSFLKKGRGKFQQVCHALFYWPSLFISKSSK